MSGLHGLLLIVVEVLEFVEMLLGHLVGVFNSDLSSSRS
jgi:hypothetical protein